MRLLLRQPRNRTNDNKMQEIRIDLSVLVYRDNKAWIAHCLEMDLPAEGRTANAAIKNFMDIAKVQIGSALDEGNLNSIFFSAPAELWRLYALGKDRLQPISDQRKPKQVNRLSVRELAPA